MTDVRDRTHVGCRWCDGSWRAIGDERQAAGRLQENWAEWTYDQCLKGAYVEARFAHDFWLYVLPSSRVMPVAYYTKVRVVDGVRNEHRVPKLADGGVDFRMALGFTVDVKGVQEEHDHAGKREPATVCMTQYGRSRAWPADAYVVGVYEWPHLDSLRWAGWFTGAYAEREAYEGHRRAPRNENAKKTLSMLDEHTTDRVHFDGVETFVEVCDGSRPFPW